jgi:hypothetical protein
MNNSMSHTWSCYVRQLLLTVISFVGRAIFSFSNDIFRAIQKQRLFRRREKRNILYIYTERVDL